MFMVRRWLGDQMIRIQVMWLPVLEAAHFAGNGLVLAEGSHRWVVVPSIYQDFWDLSRNTGISEIYWEISRFTDIARGFWQSLIGRAGDEDGDNHLWSLKVAQGGGWEWNLEQLHFKCLRPASGRRWWLLRGQLGKWEEKMTSSIIRAVQWWYW